MVKWGQSFQRGCCSSDTLISLSFRVCNDLPVLMIGCRAVQGTPSSSSLTLRRPTVYIKDRFMALWSSVGVIWRSLVVDKMWSDTFTWKQACTAKTNAFMCHDVMWMLKVNLWTGREIHHLDFDLHSTYYFLSQLIKKGPKCRERERQAGQKTKSRL